MKPLEIRTVKSPTVPIDEGEEEAAKGPKRNL
jgi:hypothetical protein